MSRFRIFGSTEAEADLVRRIFRLYLEHGTVAALKDALDKDGLLTKTRAAKGRSGGGRPFSRGHLYRILTNPLYRGRIHHKGETFEGQHPALVDDENWNAVQTLLEENRNGAKDRVRAKEPALLAGLLFDANGEKLASTHATKSGKRYHYYVTASALQVRGRGRAADPGATARPIRGWVRSNNADATPQRTAFQVSGLCRLRIALRQAGILALNRECRP